MIPMGMDENWKRVRFKGNKVWMAVDGEDRPLIEKGKALIKYQLDQPHQYWVHPAGIRPLDEDPAERDTTAPPHPPKKSGGSGRRRSPISKDAVGAADVPDSLKQDAISIYTDGACSGNPGPAGIGVVMYYKGHRKEISRYIGLATNNIAELEAIKTGLEAVRNRSLPVLLYTDSSYSLGLLTEDGRPNRTRSWLKRSVNSSKPSRACKLSK